MSGYFSNGYMSLPCLKRIWKVKQMDFEFAMWQLLWLCISPSRVYSQQCLLISSRSYKNVYYQKQTKNQWARDDPAFLVVLLASLLGKSCISCFDWWIRNCSGSDSLRCRIRPRHHHCPSINRHFHLFWFSSMWHSNFHDNLVALTSTHRCPLGFLAIDIFWFETHCTLQIN